MKTQNNTQHTKGKWKVIRNEKEHSVYSEYHGSVCKLPLWYGVKETEQGLDEAEANAQLISAAPDMLEALKTTMYILEKQGKTEWLCYTDAKAAIAKAEGK